MRSPCLLIVWGSLMGAFVGTFRRSIKSGSGFRCAPAYCGRWVRPAQTAREDGNTVGVIFPGNSVGYPATGCRKVNDCVQNVTLSVGMVG